MAKSRVQNVSHIPKSLYPYLLSVCAGKIICNPISDVTVTAKVCFSVRNACKIDCCIHHRAHISGGMFIQLRLPFLLQERDILADLVVTVIPSRLFSMVTEAEAVFPLLFADLEAVCQVES